ncbi:NAD(P)-dependent oxidoreductase [Haliea sp. E1-2-M8]|uniref:NAD(P)-dependent oxidoreductase n=1 Tax=Haliea sp. E1-2-M8 TaxID=3064706 RepID=UPI0027157AEA|nr:NAD(P)-dependent oxidoreductase [Haliea sp. E1-2-M8]MDO8863779.1 NAD(P)-dependent oxidoreductase [Haliea sp. E1-2-M8]
MSKTKIGFIGLGTMGIVMARRLMDAGYPLTVWNRTKASGEPLITEGATWADSPGEVAAISDVVFTIVSDAAASEAVICGPGGILEGAAPGLIVIDSASIAPEASRAHAERARSKDVYILDAPVSGGPKVAEKGALGIMVGGSKEAFDTCEPILKELGSMVLYAGDSGNGTTLKVIANLVMGVAIQASAEALVLAAKAGIDPQVVIDITSLPGTGPQTGAMATRGPRMISRSFFPPHFSANNMYKDLSGAMHLAEQLGVSLPTVSAARELLRAVIAQGKGKHDSSEVVTILEAMAATSVGK